MREAERLGQLLPQICDGWWRVSRLGAARFPITSSSTELAAPRMALEALKIQGDRLLSPRGPSSNVLPHKSCLLRLLGRGAAAAGPGWCGPAPPAAPKPRSVSPNATEAEWFLARGLLTAAAAMAVGVCTAHVALAFDALLPSSA